MIIIVRWVAHEHRQYDIWHMLSFYILTSAMVGIGVCKQLDGFWCWLKFSRFEITKCANLSIDHRVQVV